jgi:hypothetical protein
MSRPSVSQQPEHLAHFSGHQDRVVSRAQLARAGYDADAVANRVQTRRWQALGRAIVLHDGPVSPRQRLWVAVLTAPGPAIITGRTAAARFGLRGFAANTIDVLVPATAKPVDLEGTTWRRCQTFNEVVVAPSSGPAMATPAQSIVDAARWTARPRPACGLIAAAVQQRVISARVLRDQLESNETIRHHRILNLVAADIEGGADSLGEIDFTKLARKARLRPPIRQSVRLDSFGRRRFLDADFETFAVEVDGGVHLQAETYWNDAHRQNELVLGGDRILRFPTIAFRLDEDAVVAQLARAKEIFG